MRILYVSIIQAYPLPANNGSKMRLWAVMRAIANAGHKVSLAAFCEPEEIDGTEPELRAVCEESEVIPLHYARLSEGGDYLRRLRAIVSPSPFTIDRFRSDDMRLRLQRKANNRSFDVVICDNVYSAINGCRRISDRDEQPECGVPYPATICGAGEKSVQGNVCASGGG